MSALPSMLLCLWWSHRPRFARWRRGDVWLWSGGDVGRVASHRRTRCGDVGRDRSLWRRRLRFTPQLQMEAQREEEGEEKKKKKRKR